MDFVKLVIREIRVHFFGEVIVTCILLRGDHYTQFSCFQMSSCFIPPFGSFPSHVEPIF